MAEYFKALLTSDSVKPSVDVCKNLRVSSEEIFLYSDVFLLFKSIEAVISILLK